MKNLNLFLWIFTTAIATFFAYHTYTHTRIRYKDLESVMQQNLAVEKGTEITRLNTKKQFEWAEKEMEDCGNSPRDVATIKKAQKISHYADSLNKVIAFQRQNWVIQPLTQKVNLAIQKLESYDCTFSAWVAKQDTSLKDLIYIVPVTYNTSNILLPFAIQNTFDKQFKLAKTERRAVDKIVSRVGCCSWHFDKIIAMASPKSFLVREGQTYKANMILTVTNLEGRPKMQISEGIVNVRRDVGSIEIKNVKAQNYNREGKATKIITGKIIIKKADGSDTTFTLSTSYTIKKK
jgi:hypothetical protein